MFVASTFLDPCTIDIQSSPETSIMMLNSCNIKKDRYKMLQSTLMVYSGLTFEILMFYNHLV